MNKPACPICGRVLEGPDRAEWPEWPFCSRRCKTIDLGRWLGENYRIPSLEATEEPSDAEVDIP
jgi:endogenous inhibitor of DNA gyrase (YacG/DUF329 family)